jgi:hypothetical protein
MHADAQNGGDEENTEMELLSVFGKSAVSRGGWALQQSAVYFRFGGPKRSMS